MPRGPGVCIGALVLKIEFSLPAALCLLAVVRLFPLVRDSTDGWYSLAEPAGADEDGGSGIIASWSSRIYLPSRGRLVVLPVLVSLTLALSTDRKRPLLLVVATDDVVDIRLGALRLGGSERVPVGGAYIDWLSPRIGWRID